MVINKKPKEKKKNYFMTTDEAMILWRYSALWGSKWQVLIGLCMFRGLRIGEAVAVNIKDFSDDKFDKLRVILQKSYVVDEFPIIKGFDAVLKNYIKDNVHLLKDGWLFPSHSSQSKTQHMTVDTAITKLYKMRLVIGRKHPEFLDKIIFPHSKSNNSSSGNYERFRISFHSLRRWFETNIWDKYKDKMMLRDVMRYSHSKTVDVYINPYEVWKKERTLLNDCFSDLFKDFEFSIKGQTKLSMF